MRMTAEEIAALVEGTLEGTLSEPLSGAAGLGEAFPHDVSFLANPKYADRIATSRAGVIFVPEGLPAQSRPVIKVKNPQLAFARVLALLQLERAPYLPRSIHSTAIIGEKVTLGKDVAIGAFVIVEAGARIGSGSTLMAHSYIGHSSTIGDHSFIYPHVTIRENVQVGSRVIIHSGAVIGADGFGFVPGPAGHTKIHQIGKVIIGNDVEIGANATIDRATTGATTIGKGSKIDNLVQIAHNVHIGEHCLIVSQAGIAGSTRIGNFVTLAGQSGTVGHISIGDGAIIAARAGVIGNVKPKVIVSGYPARPHREALKTEAMIRRLPDIYAWFKKARTGPGQTPAEQNKGDQPPHEFPDLQGPQMPGEKTSEDDVSRKTTGGSEGSRQPAAHTDAESESPETVQKPSGLADLQRELESIVNIDIDAPEKSKND